MVRCLIALGSNLGEPSANLRHALARIAALPCTQVTARSRWHRTDPVGGPSGQQSFLNGAVEVATSLEPDELGRALLQIEEQMGRQRDVRWDARIIDIDLVLYGHATVETVELVVPHPRMLHRRFVLEPAAEIAGQMSHPLAGWTICNLLRHLTVQPRTVAVTAANRGFAAWFAAELDRRLGGIVPWAGHSPPAERLHAGLALHEASRPGLVLALEADLTAEAFREVRESIAVVGQQGEHPLASPEFAELGPVSRIKGNDPWTMLTEAEAAARAAWPDQFPNDSP